MGAFHLGVNLGHERSAAIVRDGRVEVAIEQERIDRRKFSVGLALQAPEDTSLVSLPWQAIRYCLDACGIGLDEVATITANMPGIDRAGEILAGTLPPEVAGRARVIPSHHLAHAYSAYWPSGFDEAGILVVDASGTTFPDGTTESYSLYDAAGGNIRLVHSERVPAHLAGLCTLGFLYEYVTRKAGFVTPLGEHLEHPEAGKLMGLAPYGRHQPRLRRWVLPEDDSYRLRIPGYDIFLEIAALEKQYDDGAGKPYLRPWVVDLACHAQRELEDALVHLGRRLLAETGRTRLCLAGGVALNSVANYALLTRLALEDIFVFPAAGDSGVAAGCAWWAYRTLESGRERHRLLHAGLGRPYRREQVCEAIADFDDSLCVEELDAGEMVARTAQMLARGQIVARFEGGSEYGPRALGHRSILADPAFARMKDILNARVKFREAFRPFAPAVPLEAAAQVFDCPVSAPFMLLVAPVHEQHRAGLPAITHVDGTGRVQTLTEAENPFLHGLCHALSRSRPGPAVVLNTSFNVAGQPIVETPREAIETFLATDIDALALEGFWIRKRGVPVLDYADHLARVEDGPLPHGLGADLPDLTPVMADLDSALFAGTPSRFAAEELQRLAPVGARFKETSVLFPGLGPLGELNTRLSDSAVVVLAGPAGALLCDLAGRRPPQRLTQDEAILLLALNARDQDAVQAQRCRMRLTSRLLRERICALAERARRFGVDLSPGPEPAGPALRAAGPAGEIFPCLDGTDPDTRRLLGRLRQVLDRAGYTGPQITRLLGVSQQQLLPTHLHYWATYRLDAGPLADLIRLFHLRQTLDRDRLTEVLGAELTDFLQRQNLLIPRDGGVASRVDLFELEGLYLATDHRFCLLEEDRIGEEPVMYLGTDSIGLVHVTPTDPARTTLDLCCGSGVQALTASRWSRQVIGVDLNPRAIRFSIFNALLNGIDNVQFRRGDLYTPVTGQRFDVILANPPFVPSPETGYQFRDGGHDGERVLRPIIEGSPHHLSDGGRLAVVTDLVDLPGYQTKLRRWWSGGAAAALVLSTADRDEALFAVPHCHAPFGQSFRDYNDQLERWVDNYREAGLTAVNFGYILLERSPAGGDLHYTARTIHSPTSAIHGDIRRHFRQQHLLRGDDRQDLRINVHPAIRIREQSTPDGSQRQLELIAEGNESFSSYAISSQIRDLLRALAPHGQRWSTLAALAPESVLDDLLAKGILILDGAHSDTGKTLPVSMFHADRPHPNGAADRWTLHERPSRTTPTCLTSYLR